MSYIIWSFTFPRDICLLCDNEGQFVSSSGLYFINKRCIGNPMICQFTLHVCMTCDLPYLLVKCSHELEGIMAIYDNMRTNELI